MQSLQFLQMSNTKADNTACPYVLVMTVDEIQSWTTRHYQLDGLCIIKLVCCTLKQTHTLSPHTPRCRQIGLCMQLPGEEQYFLLFQALPE